MSKKSDSIMNSVPVIRLAVDVDCREVLFKDVEPVRSDSHIKYLAEGKRFGKWLLANVPWPFAEGVYDVLKADKEEEERYQNDNQN